MLEIGANPAIIPAEMSENLKKSFPVLVAPGSGDLPLPPRPLPLDGQVLWEGIQGEFRITDTAGVELLMQACEAVDLIGSLKAAIERDGAILLVRGSPKVHPGIREQLAARGFVVRTLQKLGVTAR
jgi:hypothetical protein